MKVFALCLLFITSLAQCLALDQATVDAISVDLRTTIDATEEEGFKRLIPGIIRMVFHDCVDGCDACLNLNAAINNGISGTVHALEPVYQKHKDAISRADLWALSAKIALEMSVGLNNARCNNALSCTTPQINIGFKFGRKDCPTSPIHSDDVFIPSPFQTSEVLMPWFQEQFGFDSDAVVAIMGLHTLGRAGPPFNRAWEPENRDGLSNFYFKQMVDPNRSWTQNYFDPQVTGFPIKLYFWETGVNRAFALPIDMTLLKDIQISSPTGQSSCTSYSCMDAPTAGLFNHYANDTHEWIKAIEALFPRMLAKTSSQLQSVSSML